MNLSYTILWIENEDEFIDSFDVDDLRAYVENQGFELNLVFRMKPEEIRQEVDGTQFDLLIIDYNIAEDENLHGSDVIRQVRDKKCLTEVIFYSQNGVAELRRIAAEKELEGVFYSGRPTDQLLPKIKDVFNLTVRKVVDVDNMRGIVMSGVADLDYLITDVIRTIHTRLDAGQQATLCKRLLEKMKPVVKHLSKLLKEQEHPSIAEIDNLLKSVVALDPAEFEVLLQARHFDSSKRVDMAISLCKEHEDLAPHKDSINAIRALLQWRNALAHQRTKKFTAAGHPIFEPVEGTEEAFDDRKTMQLRQELRRLRKALEAAREALTPKISA